ncbi:hypothetical protein PDIG_42130 [Penicillium digitatum PHI26]|uniref:Rhodopsin domain-containing protein n=2 Tax=Penicillium digitatum TaxID=36651 RepID=K9FW39_PEND2|nr:hypothetical protein PDIP_40750 [Penicillium digitatum Pd1]EKV12777.1 hypothetical protein PDIG_42130 [Penicillium digitatum PHI26]EKV15323.1 hypothetical protein PDIP_40750 [Penicillium digitatum Pd1]
MSVTLKTWPSGVSPPLTTNNDHDHSGLVVVITAFNLCLVLFSLGARTFSSYHRNRLQRDDYTFGALVLASIGQIIIVFCEVHYGWGTQIDGIETTRKEQMLKVGRCGGTSLSSRVLNNTKIVYAADLVSIVVLGLSKMTACMFYEGLFAQIQLRISYFMVPAMVAWTLLSALLLGIRCSSNPWSNISAAECSGLRPRWEVITALDIATEILLIIYAALAIWEVRISTKQKIVVFCALESRILLIPIAAVRLHYVLAQLSSEDPSLLGSFATVSTEMYIGLSAVFLLTAFLKSFIAVYEDDLGISYRYRGPSKSDSRSRSAHPNDTLSHRLSRSVRTERVKGWEGEEDPIIDSSEHVQGLQIMKTVHLSVEDESIELPTRGGASGI